MKFAAMLVMLFACTPKQYTDTYPPFPPSTVQADSAMQQFFATIQKDLKTECVFCLYGRVKGDTVQIAFIRPALLASSTEASAHYLPCPRPNPEVFGSLLYLGTAHQHPGGSGHCGFSAQDSRSFDSDKFAIIDAVICNGDILWRHR